MEKRRVIKVFGAREHNLKNISVEIPKEQLTVITGPSGSGKSSLALDILYAEGQRRYMESLSSYARQFLGMPKRPDVDRIEGLCPAIAIEQKTVGSNPRSTVGTITEIYDYLRVLFARIGLISCPGCHNPVAPADSEKIVTALTKTLHNHFVMVAAPLAIEKKGEFVNQLQELFLQGHYRFMIDGARYSFKSIEEIKALNLKKTFKHTIYLLVDALDITREEESRLHEAVERACVLSAGRCTIIAGEKEYHFSSERMCITCSRSFAELEPRLFSFNNPLGACKGCHGLGVTLSSAYEAMMRDGMQPNNNFEEVTCTTCSGQRLNQDALNVTIAGKNIFEIGQLSIKQLHEFFNGLKLDDFQKTIVDRLLYEIIQRCNFLIDVGLDYLSLNRTARTLSGGEGQRIRLAKQIGSALSGVLYILDEPSIGLHQRDNDRLIATLKKLRDNGNTVVVVEHDHDTMLNADYLIDMGPQAGILGGNIVSYGTPRQVSADPQSLTGAYLAGSRKIARLQPLKTPHGYLVLHDAQVNNLKKLTVKFPLGV
ncbi:MAG: ABC-ATPase UvrA, partial [Candidatus Dependentiae bacterium]|nr:ABC-ATPase UvrA [Candidatus Dependentiae bacterium]